MSLITQVDFCANKIIQEEIQDHLYQNEQVQGQIFPHIHKHNELYTTSLLTSMANMIMLKAKL